jgi:hypothetical protein
VLSECSTVPQLTRICGSIPIGPGGGAGALLELAVGTKAENRFGALLGNTHDFQLWILIACAILKTETRKLKFSGYVSSRIVRSRAAASRTQSMNKSASGPKRETIRHISVRS